ncbi:hypothetical protein HMPREF9103_02956 [Lentilactobacillus parafarraginis F0439]|uniref:Transposase IS66 central domain-containing protein n=1 Tax=Lentilactobacillus parafarraginis F0439 TaxID=797515 RepID=G9ZT84_9LACO|nr:hypothetical protein HMPREF9103_02956 [Lentilactobacillus parafarraginis F0439]
MCDGYSGYDCAGCWAHCRRKFFEAKNGAESRQSRSQEIVSIIDQMFGLKSAPKALLIRNGSLSAKNSRGQS